MLQSVEGTYEEGELRLQEPATVSGRWRIVVTFLEPLAAEEPQELEDEDEGRIITFYSRHTEDRLRDIDRKRLEARELERPY